MCCSIKLLREGNTPVSDEEIKAAALQLVRKISSYRKPSKANEEVFESPWTRSQASRLNCWRIWSIGSERRVDTALTKRYRPIDLFRVNEEAVSRCQRI